MAEVTNPSPHDGPGGAQISACADYPRLARLIDV